MITLDAATLTALGFLITAIGSIITAIVGAYILLATKRVERAANGLTARLVETTLFKGQAEGRAEVLGALGDAKQAQGTAEGKAIGLEIGRAETGIFPTLKDERHL